MIDSYLTISKRSEALLKEKSSKFHAYAFPVENTQEVEEAITLLKKEHLKARHFCYAYFLDPDRQQFRANDDGEPSGTAGRPILGQLEKRKLTNTLVVVVRYFGGTKLGTSGLIQAYKESASLALEQARIIEKIIPGNFYITCSFEQIGPLMSMISAENITILDSIYDTQVQLNLSVRRSEVKNAVNKLKAQLLNRSMSDVHEDTEVPGVTFAITEGQ